MRVLVGNLDRGPLLSTAMILSAVALLTHTVLTGRNALTVAPAALLIVGIATAHRFFLRWDVLLATLLLLIMLVPIKRYRLPGDLPFDIEPYRLLVVAIAVGWLSSLLVDPRVRIRHSGLETPMFAFIFAILVSIATNEGRVSADGSEVAKQVSFFASFILLFYVIVSVVRTRAAADLLVTILVVSGSLVGGATVVEFWSGYNVFNHLSNVFPVFEFRGVLDQASIERSGRLRTYASAQHPIALAAALVMVAPLGLYLALTRRRVIWWMALGLICLGALATVSRTGVMMFLTVGIILWRLRPQETRRLLPAAVPALVIVFLALPNALGSFKAAFFPQTGLIAEQSAVVPGNELRANNRLADIGPSLKEFSRRPLTGAGFGTRVVGPGRATPILDNQWLGMLLEIGALGTLAFAWLIARAMRRLGRTAKRDDSPTSVLAAALASSVAAFSIGMLTFDTFAFIQVTFLFFIIAGLACALLAIDRTSLVGLAGR